MIATFGVLSVRIAEPHSIHLWIPLPLFLLWLILLPLAVVWVPLVFITCWIVEVNPWRAISVTWQLLAGLRNTRLHVDHRKATVYVSFF